MFFFFWGIIAKVGRATPPKVYQLKLSEPSGCGRILGINNVLDCV
jgi:hypothetical protein